MRYLSLLFTFFIVLGLSATDRPAAAQSICRPNRDYVEIGQEAMDEGDYPAAYEAYSCAVEDEPDNMALYMRRGEAALLSVFLTDKIPVVMENYDRVSATEPDVIFETLDDYTRQIEDNPDDVTLYMRRSFLNWFIGNDAEAFADYEVIIEALPDNAFGYLFRGSSLQFMGEIDAATEDFDKAVDLLPDRGLVYTTIARTFIETAAYDWAVEYLSQGIDELPESQGLYWYRARSFGFLGEFESALDDMDTLIDLDPEAAPAYSLRAVIYFELGDYEAALDDLDSAARLDPENTYPGTSSVLLRGHVLNAMEEPEAAAESLADYISLVETDTQRERGFGLDDPMTVKVGRGLTSTLTFKAEAGDVLSFMAVGERDDSGAIQPLLVILGPDGDPLAGNTIFNSPIHITAGLTETRIEAFEAPESGRYTLLVATVGCECQGEVEITMLLDE